MLAATSITASAELKLATVDVATLFDSYYKTAQMQKVVNLEKAKMQKENDEKLKVIQNYKSKHDDLRKKLEDPSLGEKKKVEFLKEFEQVRQSGTAAERERVEYVQRRSKALSEKAAEDARSIFTEINAEVTVVAKADKYDLVIDPNSVGGKGIPIFLYCSESFDITEQVSKKLSEKAPK